MRIALALSLCCACSRSVDLYDAGMQTDVDVIGAWHDCQSTVRFDLGGVAHRIDYRTGCEANGTWEIHGSVFTSAWAPDDCGAAAITSTRQAARTATSLVLVDAAADQVARYASDAVPRSYWRWSEVGGSRATIARIVGTPGEGFGTGCYWSEDGECGGLLSCSGTIASWRVNETFAASTVCGVDCPCAAILTGDRAADGTLYGSFQGVNCDGEFAGEMIATPLAE